MSGGSQEQMAEVFMNYLVLGLSPIEAAEWVGGSRRTASRRIEVSEH